MRIVVRSVEALGSSASGTASLAIASYTFPDRVSTVLVISRKHFLTACVIKSWEILGKDWQIILLYMQGLQQAFSSVGLMVGPPVGDILFDVSTFIWYPMVCKYNYLNVIDIFFC